MGEKFLTMHPDPSKQGVNISKAKYDLVRAAIEGVLRTRGEVTFRSLLEAVAGELEGSFEGSVPWYVTTVKLDLEARGVLERVLGSSPQRLRLVG